MRGPLHSLTRRLRLVLACLALAAVSPAQVASAADAVTVVEGGPGRKPVEVAARAEVHAHPAEATRGPRALPAFARLAPPAEPIPSSAPLFLLHRALLV